MKNYRPSSELQRAAEEHERNIERLVEWKLRRQAKIDEEVLPCGNFVDHELRSDQDERQN